MPELTHVLSLLCSELTSFTAASSFQPLIDVRDRGSIPNEETCQLTIDLFNIEDTVRVTLGIDLAPYDPVTFAQITSNILDLDIFVTSSERHNATTYLVDILGRDAQVLVPADELVVRLLDLISTPNQVGLLTDAGLTILDVMSSAGVPTTTTPTSGPIPTRPFPSWAVAVIVVLNSVIIIGVLLVILVIILRRFRR